MLGHLAVWRAPAVLPCVKRCM